MTDAFKTYRDRVTNQLKLHLDQVTESNSLRNAMQHGVFNGGKRIRPLLVYLAAEALDTPPALCDRTATAIECLHCYSLIHDDLPSMDDDDLRRGQPTVHVRFDEATAILAGDALQSLAFELIADESQLDPEIRVKLINLIARAVGGNGMVAGQMIDLHATDSKLTDSELENMHRRKTGDLISASVMSGSIISGADSEITHALQTFGYALGLAFQVKDDILDETGDTRIMGKKQGADQSLNKPTFTSTYGLNEAVAYLDQLRVQAIEALNPLGVKAEMLLQLTDFIANRDH